jgi:hypothetical protein
VWIRTDVHLIAESYHMCRTVQYRTVHMCGLYVHLLQVTDMQDNTVRSYSIAVAHVGHTLHGLTQVTRVQGDVKVQVTSARVSADL